MSTAQPHGVVKNAIDAFDVRAPRIYALEIWVLLPTKVAIAKDCVLTVARRYPNRKINVCGDAAYMSQALRKLPSNITWTSRLSSNAALFQFQPPRTGKRGRPALKGERLPKLKTIAKNATWEQVDVHRYSSSEGHDNATTVEVYSFTCL